MTDWKKQLVTFVVFLFPVLAISLEHAGSSLYGIIVLLSLVYGWQGLKHVDKEQKQFFAGLLILFIIIAIGVTYSIDAKEGLSKLERYLRVLLIIPAYLMMRRFQLVAGKAFLAGVVIAICVLVIQGWYQTEIIKAGAATGAYHKIIFGDVSVLFLAIIVAGSLTIARNKRQLSLFIVIALAGIYPVIASWSRAAWLFIPILSVVMLFLYRQRLSKRTWQVILLTGLVVIVGIAVVKPDKISNGFKAGIADIQKYQENPEEFSSWGARLTFWRNSLIMFSESPFVGKGTGSYQAENIILLEKGITNAEYVTKFGHAHSIYFHILAENGILGLLAMSLVILVLPFRYFYLYWKQSKTGEQRFYTLSGMLVILAFAWFGASEMWLARNPFVNVYFISVLVFMSSTANVFAEKNRVTQGQKE